ncbi:MAG TPA: pseudouridine synthase [Bacteroidales bacterium]|nr:pseudouridine synthase [Bacteroidales bacterium]
MTEDNTGKENPGGLSSHNDSGKEHKKRPRKPLFSTSYFQEGNKNEPSSKSEEEQKMRKRPPRKRIVVKPIPKPSSEPLHNTQKEDEPYDDPYYRREVSGGGWTGNPYSSQTQYPEKKRPLKKKIVSRSSKGKTSSTSGKPGIGKLGPKRSNSKKFITDKPRFEKKLKKERAPLIPAKFEGPVRLNRFIAAAGICSRREADRLIEAGEITVNGQVVTTLGSRVNPGDKVMYKGRVLQTENKYYILLNKPRGYVTTMDDPAERQTVMELVKDACEERIFPVGRLDRNTTGLLLLTNDGELAKKLTHPSHRIRKIYEVELDRPLTKSDMMRIASGIELEDGVAEVDAIAYVGKGEDRTKIGIELHSGKNRVVRRIFEKLRYHVKKLDRVTFGSLTKKDLPRGRWRYLTEHEVNFLKML